MSAQRVLAATDGSPVGRWIVVRAAGIARRLGMAVHVVRVAEPGATDAALDGARRDVAREAARVEPKPVADVMVGTPFVEIVRRARALDAALVVMGAHGSGGRRARLVGNTTSRVVRKGDRSTLVVREAPRGPYRRVLVGVDLSDASAQAVSSTRALFPDAAIVLVHCFQTVGKGLARGAGASRRQVAELQQAAADSVRPSVDGFVDRLDVPVDDVVMAEGAPAPTLLRLASEHTCRLVAVGAHGSSGLRHVLLGSVAHSVLADARHDVLVVRSGRRDFELP